MLNRISVNGIFGVNWLCCTWSAAFVLVCGFAAMSGCGSSKASPMPAFGSGLPAVHATPEIRTLEHRMFERVNQDRKKNGLPPLAYDERLADAGRSHSADMQQHHFFDHDSPTYGNLAQRLTRAGYVYLTSRENLAEAINVDEAEEGLLKSPHHYENLMASDITHVGIGIVRGGVQDPRNLTVTQVFATPGKNETGSEAMRRIEQSIQSARKQAGLPTLARLSRLDDMAQRQLEGLKDQLVDESKLKPIAKSAVEELAKNPIPKVSGVSAGGQVVVDSSQFQAQGGLLQSSAKGYGLAVAYGKDNAGARRLKVLYLVGL